MSTTPLSGSILAHFFIKDEKLSVLKTVGVLIGFSGIILLFFDKVVINSNNYIFALITRFLSKSTHSILFEYLLLDIL